MEASILLKIADINPEEQIPIITAEGAAEYLLEAIEEYCPDLKIDKMTKEDLRALFSSYSECIILYHPENYQQERAALLRNFEMLKRYGLTDEDFACLDFC